VGDLLYFSIGPRRGMRRAVGAASWYDRGCALEACDPGAAADAYRRALAGQPDLADAHNNLGRLLHDRGDLAGAESCYRLAICAAPAAAALYWFNLGVVVEDQGRGAEAIAAYERALELDPAIADAHFNLARLCELRGRETGEVASMQAAVRHLLAYRRLVPMAVSRTRRR
jgi:tetratricopeptide (TPR) repeat protein